MLFTVDRDAIREILEEHNQEAKVSGELEIPITDTLITDIIGTIEYCAGETAYECIWDHVSHEYQKLNRKVNGNQ